VTGTRTRTRVTGTRTLLVLEKVRTCPPLIFNLANIQHVSFGFNFNLDFLIGQLDVKEIKIRRNSVRRRYMILKMNEMKEKRKRMRNRYCSYHYINGKFFTLTFNTADKNTPNRFLFDQGRCLYQYLVQHPSKHKQKVIFFSKDTHHAPTTAILIRIRNGLSMNCKR
jgi:hypothetical protein